MGAGVGVTVSFTAAAGTAYVRLACAPHAALHGEALLLVQRLMSLHYDLTHVKEGALFLTHL